MKVTTFPSDEEFIPYKEIYEEQSKVMFGLPLDELRKLFNNSMLPPNAPVEGEDFATTHRMIPVRDGSEIEVRIYRSLKVKGNGKSALVLRLHGGGKFPFQSISCSQPIY